MFDRYERAIRSLPRRDEYKQEELLIAPLLIAREGRMSVYYTPFDWANTGARVVLLGITPGWTQMERAYHGARAAIDEGKSANEICRAAKLHGAFAGPLRKNLLRMLDEIGLPKALDIRSAEELFGGARHLLHTASAIRYPVFVDGNKNYTGSPLPEKSPFLMDFARTILGPELQSVGDALIVPLGKSVEGVLRVLSNEGRLSADRWLSGFPHPSGANGHRVRIFAENRVSLCAQVQRVFGRRARGAS